jgi:hypothetical protein
MWEATCQPAMSRENARKCEVGPQRGAGLSTGPFLRPASRAGRARSPASGSPRGHAAVAALVYGVGMRVPR